MQQAEPVARRLLLVALDALPLGPAAAAGPGAAKAGAPAAAAAAPPPLLPLWRGNRDSVAWLARVIVDAAFAEAQQGAAPAVRGGAVGALPGGLAPPSVQDAGPRMLPSGDVLVPWREAVECKNHCPFTLRCGAECPAGRGWRACEAWPGGGVLAMAAAVLP